MAPAWALGLRDIPFLASGPPECAAMARAIPQGKRVEISGSDTFNEMILPLVKALRRFQALAAWSSVPAPPCAILCIAVVDAPMLLVEEPTRAGDPLLCPWVRVVRREAKRDRKGWSLSPSRLYGIDVVHEEFLKVFLDSHLKQFADAFVRRIIECPWIFDGRGVVDTIDAWSWKDVRKKA
jgi:hypothetical protein